MRQQNLDYISKLLFGLKHYQDYSISYNGETDDKTVTDLLNRIDINLDDQELGRLGLMSRNGQTAEVMEYLSTNPDTDFYFHRTVE